MNPITSTLRDPRRTSRRLLAPAILLGSLLIILAPLFFFGRTLAPVYALGMLPTGAYGYSGPEQQLFTSRDPVGAMGADYAEWGYVSRALGEGEIPFWNPYQGLGRPLVAEQTAGVFFPVSLLRHVVPPAYWDLVGVLSLLLASIFLVMLARIVGLRGRAAIFVGLSAFASGYFQIYASVITIIGSSVWLPLLLFGVEWAHRNPGKMLRGVPVLVSAFALGTAGHATPAIFSVIFFGIYVVVRAWQEPRTLHTLLDLLPYLAGGALLAAPQWLEFVQYITSSNRELLTFYAVPYTFHRFWHLPAMVFPYLYGPLNQLQPLGISALDLKDFWGQGWLPAAVMFPAFLGIWRVARLGPPAGRAMLIALAVMTLWALHCPPFTLLAHVPLLWRLNFNYFWVPLQVVLLVHAGFGLAYLARADDRGWRRAIVGWLVFCTAMLLVAFVYLGYEIKVAGKSGLGLQPAHLVSGLAAGMAWAIAVPLCLRAVRVAASGATTPFHVIAVAGVILSAIGYFPYANQPSIGIARWGAIAAYLAITAAYVVIARWRRPDWQRRAWALVPVAGVILAYGATVLKAGLPARLDPIRPAPYVGMLQARAGSDRVYGIDGFMTLNFAGAFGLSAVNNLTALMPPEPRRLVESYLDHHQFAGQFYGIPQWGRVTPVDPLGQFEFNRRFWDHLGVRYLVLGASHANERIVAAATDEVSMLHGDPRPRGQVPYGDPAGASWAALRPGPHPGEPAWVDAPVSCGHGAFRSVDVWLGTGGVRQSGRVELQVWSQGLLFTRAEVDASKVINDAFNAFTFPRTVCTDLSAKVQLRLWHHSPDPNVVLGYLAPNGAPGFIFRRMGGTLFHPGTAPPATADEFQPAPLHRAARIAMRCPGGPISAMEIRVGTHGRTNPGRLVLTIRAAEGDAAVLGQSVIDSARVVDNAMVRFAFNAPVCDSSERNLVAELAHEGGVPGHELTYWVSRRTNLIDHAVKAPAHDGVTEIYVDEKSGARVWENHRAQPRVYVAPEFVQRANGGDAMRSFAEQADLRRAAVGERGGPVCRSNPAHPMGEPGAKVHRISVGPNTIEAELDARTAGTLVVTDNYMPGWQAEINGKSEPAMRVNGTFRGVCIPAPGHYKVSWRYSPPLWTLSLWMAAAGAALVIAAFAYSHARRK